MRQPIYDSAVGRWGLHKEFLGPLLVELGIAGISNPNCNVDSTGFHLID
jgi:hypothetical protein